MNTINGQHILEDIKANPHLLSFFARHNCKHCRGRGYIEREISSGGKWEKVRNFCDCVYKAINKAAKT